MSENPCRPEAAAAENVRGLSVLDIPGGGQVVVRDGYAYIGHMRPPHGTSIIDVRDPLRPSLVAEVPPPSPYSHAHKVRVLGDLMIVNVEQDRRHFLRKAEAIPTAEAALRAELGREPDDAELAAAIAVDAGDLAELRAGLVRGYDEGGFRLFDVSDKTRPREIGYQRTGGVGAHRFDMDARYAYVSTEMDGYLGNILVIYDIARPEAPEEVSRWWMPGQHLAGGERPSWQGRRHRLHHALREGDRLWAGCWYAGAYVIDIAEIAQPRTVGHVDFHPPSREPTHTFFKPPHRLGGREVAILVDEEHEGHVRGQPHGSLWVVDVADVENIRPLATFEVSERDSPFARAGGRFGAHQFQEHMDGTLVFAAWFAGGLRVVDLADPTLPRAVGAYVPAPLPGQVAPQSNDVEVDERGIVYLLDRNRGLHILEFGG
jgi:hypothetical protein